MNCSFPFVIDGISYNGCTMHGIEDTEYMPWCSTKVDDDGKHTKGNWGDCSSECPVDQTCKCIFPFKFYGKVHNKCTMEGSPNGMPWCAIEVDAHGCATLDWSICSHECPFEQGKYLYIYTQHDLTGFTASVSAEMLLF